MDKPPLPSPFSATRADETVVRSLINPDDWPHACKVPPSKLKALKPLQILLLVVGLMLFAVPTALD